MNDNILHDDNLTDDERKEELLSYEQDILAGLLKAGDFQSEESCTINVSRAGKTLFSFRIHPLSDEKIAFCRQQATKYKRNRRTGLRSAEDMDLGIFRNYLIYEATVKEDQEKLWQNKAAWKHYDVVNPYDLIGKILKPGEKGVIAGQIDELCGYGISEDDMVSPEELAKN